MQVTEKSDGSTERSGRRLAVTLACGAFVIVALAVPIGLGVFPGRDPLHQTPEPRTQLTVRLDTAAVPQLVVRTLSEDVRSLMRETRIGFASIAPSGDSVEVTIREGADREQAVARLRELSRQPGATGSAETERFTVADANGAVLWLTPTPAAIADGLNRALDQTIDILDRRIGSLELKPTFKREGGDGIVIEVPRQPDTTSLKAFIVAPGKLTFRFVDTSVRAEEAKLGQMPSQSEVLQDQNGTSYLVEKRVAMSGENLMDAQPGYDQRTNEPIVSFRFNPAGSRQFARVTAEKVGSPFAVVLDGVVLAVPVLREPILGGTGQISGGFTLESANNLAILLRSGALPAPLTVIEERTLERRAEAPGTRRRAEFAPLPTCKARLGANLPSRTRYDSSFT
jgi:preprotein translocase subunit SecD